jgi:hypothetical protein
MLVGGILLLLMAIAMLEAPPNRARHVTAVAVSDGSRCRVRVIRCRAASMLFDQQAGNMLRIGAQGRAVGRTIPEIVRERRLAWMCPFCWLMSTL